MRPTPEPIDILLLGPLTLLRAGRPVSVGEWHSRQERRLLAILISAAGRVVAASQIVEWIWPEADRTAAAATLRSVVSNLRRTLEGEHVGRASRNFILTRPGGYAWNVAAAARLDIDTFRTLLAGLEDAPLAQIERALALYRGDYLDDEPDAPWAMAERERLRDLFLRASAAAAAARLERGEYAAARLLAQRGLERAPLYEPLHALVMRAAVGAGDTSGALQQYERFRRDLDEELGALPSARLSELHAAVLRGELAPGRAPSATLPSLAGATPFVGRDAELAALGARFDELRHRRGGTIAFVGEAGIGKTRLAAEGLRMAALRGAQVIALRCTALDSGIPFAAVSEAVRPLIRAASIARLRRLPQAALAQAADLLPAARERLPDLPHLPDVAPDERRRRMIDGLVDLALALTRAAPLVIWCDDAQWADEATLALLGRLARHAPRHALLLILCYRAEELPESPALHALLRALGRDRLIETLVLGRLDEAEVCALVAGVAAAEPQRVEPLARRLARLSGGNPLFLTVAIETILESHAASSLGEVLPLLDPAALPDLAGATRVRDLVQGRLDRLPAPARRLAEQLALLGRPASLDLIEQLGGVDALDAAQTLIERRFLVETANGLGFGHDLVRSAIVAGLSAPQRRLLHRRAAEAIAALARDDPAEAAELAHHYAEAGRGFERQVLRAALTAGDHARHAFGYRAARSRYDMAIAAGERPGADVDAGVLRRAFEGRLLCCEALLDWQGVQATIDRYDRWAAGRSDVPRRLVAPRRLVLLRALTGDLAGAAQLSTAAPAGESGDAAAPLLAEMLARTARILQPATDAPDARAGDRWDSEEAFQSIASFPGDPARDLPALLGEDEAALALFQIGWAVLMEGNLADARACLGRAYVLAVATSQAAAAVVAALQLAHLAALAGDIAARDRWLDISLDTARQASEAAWALIWPRIHQGFLWLLDDQFAQVEERFSEMAEQLADLPAFECHRASLQVGLGLAALGAGRFAAAAEYLAVALSSPQLLYGFVYVAAQLGMARIAALSGDLLRARRLMRHALAYSRSRGLLPEYVRTAIEIARIERDYGDPAAPVALLRSAGELAQRAGLAPLANAAAAVLARMG